MRLFVLFVPSLLAVALSANHLVAQAPTKIFLMDADGSNVKPFISMPDVLQHGDPQYSHDGKRICFSASMALGGAAKSEICIIAASGDIDTLRKIEGGRRAKWSPDDKKLLFMTRQYEDENPGIYIIDLKSEDRLRLGDGDHPSWSQEDHVHERPRI